MNKELFFLKLFNVNSEIFLGGLLKTDLLGIPVDFKYVEPIKPTKLQKILYGKSLEHFINFELISKNLLNEVSENSLVFVDDLLIFEFHEKENVVFLSLFKDKVELPDKDQRIIEFKKNENEYLVMLGNLNYRLKFKAQPSEELQNLIIEATENFELLEPFSRISEALEHIWQNSSK